MNRRQFSARAWAQLLVAGGVANEALAGNGFAFSSSEASQALKLALKRGVQSSSFQLGRLDGFMGNEKVRIPLPGHLGEAAKWLALVGQGSKVDELVLAMNRAAEAAVPLAKPVLLSAVQSMNVRDAAAILSGGDTAATDFFAEKTRAPLVQKLLPMVTRQTSKVGLAARYNDVAGKAGSLGLLDPAEANLQKYVTTKTLNALYQLIGDEERRIRKDPIGTGSDILKKVFGLVK
jgi:hypothetical protein